MLSEAADCRPGLALRLLAYTHWQRGHTGNRVGRFDPEILLGTAQQPENMAINSSTCVDQGHVSGEEHRSR